MISTFKFLLLRDLLANFKYLSKIIKNSSFEAEALVISYLYSTVNKEIQVCGSSGNNGNYYTNYYYLIYAIF